MSAPAKILVPIAHGSESLETVALVNVFRRAEFEVRLASIETELTVNATRMIKLTADQRFLDVKDENFAAIVLPGGEKGAAALSRHAPLIEKLELQNDRKRWFGAICAAPAFVLAPHHLLDGRRATCYPAFKAGLPDWVDEPVVIDGHIVTSQGPATTLNFALHWVELLGNAQLRHKIAAEMLAS